MDFGVIRSALTSWSALLGVALISEVVTKWNRFMNSGFLSEMNC